MISRTPTSLPHVAADRGCVLGHEPAWHLQENRLYWMDAATGALFHLDPSTGASGTAAAGEKVSGLVVQSDGGLLLLTRDGGVKTLHAGVVAVIRESAPWGADARIDAMAADPSGKVFCSVRAAGGKKNTLYVIDHEGGIEKPAFSVPSAGGLAFSPDGATAYSADAESRELTAWSRDPGSGVLSAGRMIARLPGSLGVPRGIALDTKGYLWVPLWGGSCIVRISPAGKEEQRVYCTARLLSGVAFGGEELRELYVTSGGADNRKASGPAAGALFMFRPGVRGVPLCPARVGVQGPSPA